MQPHLFLLIGSLIATPSPSNDEELSRACASEVLEELAKDDEFSEEEFSAAKTRVFHKLGSFQNLLSGYLDKLSPEQVKEQVRSMGFFFDEEDPEDPFLTPTDIPSSYDPNITEFEDLPLQEWEKQVITFIITEMAEKNVFQLLLEKREMEKKGKKINHVHPLRFIGYVCSDTKLKKAVRVFRKNPFKWDNFINGFSGRMREEHARNNLLRFAPSFSRHLQADEVTVFTYLQQTDCDGLVRYLTSM